MNIYLVIACLLPAIGLGAYVTIDVIANHVEEMYKSIKDYKAWKNDYWLDE